jgi:hypothetical protein
MSGLQRSEDDEDIANYDTAASTCMTTATAPTVVNNTNRFESLRRVTRTSYRRLR